MLGGTVAMTCLLCLSPCKRYNMLLTHYRGCFSWVVFLLTVPIEAILAGADVRATPGMYEKKSNQTALIFLVYNLITLSLLGKSNSEASSVNIMS